MMFVRRTLFKRIISVTLSLTLAAGFIPLAGKTVRADGEVASVGRFNQYPVENRPKYSSLAEAFAAAGAQDEITLLTDVTVTSEDLTLNLTDGGIVYLDLDGHDLVIGGSTIGSAGDGILKIWSDQNPGQITIENSTVDVAVSVNRNDTLVMAGCTVNEGLCFESGTGALYDSRINYLRLDNSHCTSLIDVQISRSDEENGNLRSCIGELSLALALDTNGYFKDGYAGVQLHVNPGCYFSQDIRDISTGNEEVICFSTFGNYEHYTDQEDWMFGHITYPYRYELPNAVVVTPPVPVEGLMAGSMADMVIPGTAQNGRMAYCVTTYLGGYQNFSTAVPKADMPGTYYVYYFAFAKASDGYFSSPFDYVMVTVSKIDPVLMLEIDDWNEGETPCTPQVSDPPTGASMIYEYKERGADDSTYSTIVPIVAGEYTVRATYPGDDIYNSASATADFSIIRTASGSGSSSGNSGSSNSGNGNTGSSSGNGGSSGNSGSTSGYSVADFVERLYTVALGRASDPVGKADWIAAVTERGQTGADLARGFLYSPEFLNKNVSNEEFVRVLYRTFFNREADAEGLAAWVATLDIGGSKQDVIEGFINSTEWANLCLLYGIANGGTGVPNIEVEPNEGTIGFATRLYTTCLNREADEAGLMAWARQLANRRDTGTGAAHGFFFSSEFLNQNVSNEEFVNRLYRTFMGREADQAGFDAWVGQLDSGVSRDDVFNGFAASQEFGVICSQYGILR